MARRDKRAEREMAQTRIVRLIQLAEAALVAKRPDRAARYGQLAWRVKTTYQLRACGIEGRICRSCLAFLSSSTARVRIRDGVRITTCLSCGALRRKPLSLRTGAKPEPRRV